MINYNDGKWHVWERGASPIHPDTVVQCVFDDGVISEGKAGDYSWEGDPNWVAFRVIKEYKPAREFWIILHVGTGKHPSVYGSDPRLDPRYKSMPTDEIIHVREVIE